MNNQLNDSDLSHVSGGAGTTKYGYFVDDYGTVTYRDQQGNTMPISAENWKWLLTQYKGPIEDPEYYLSTVPVKELESFLKSNNRI
ncbi:MAG: hypothetical protein K6G22_00375 [Lachnospiraceae bacterium]|nr:hypothetical protein [Lachnospiraceae bacterium]